jgi:hypothetical protein
MYMVLDKEKPGIMRGFKFGGGQAYDLSAD